MKNILRRKIIGYLKGADFKPVKLGKIAEELGVSSEEYPAFKEAFGELRREGQVVIAERSQIRPGLLSGRIAGTFRSNPKGFGFVTPLEHSVHKDLFIPPDATKGAVNGDIVSAVVVSKQTRGNQVRYRGRIVEILERAENRFVGTLAKTSEGWVVMPDGTGFVEPISVDDVTAKSARPKDKVVVEILAWPTQRYFARGVIVEVLGRSGQYEAEINSVIRQFHIPCEFSEGCIAQARDSAQKFEKAGDEDREDITNKVVITIDPPDAKDFDDAISLELNGDGSFCLGVHIADVSSFIETETPLDSEARLRGNSAYLPGRTIPMLPEILSNGICSLQPAQKRFVKSVYITYDENGEVVHRRFANSVMSSTQRLTYVQADKALKGHKGEVKPEVLELLREMEKLSRLIEKRRMEAGMIHLNLPETELVLDKAGRVVDAQPAENSYPHTIIEMFMVEANEAVATLLDRFNVPFMRRIHPEPDVMSMKELARLVGVIGYRIPRIPNRAAIQDLLSAVEGKDAEPAINMLVLRSLEKAVYSPQPIGHFALASRDYCHFTSPIRRYADLLVHRLLAEYLKKGTVSADQRLDLIEVGKHISFTEERAEDAEEELKTVLILQMLKEHIGEELDCIISGLTNFGIFLQSKKFGIEGLVPLSQLGGDDWSYNPKSNCVVGNRSGKVIVLGQPMKAKINSVNVAARQLNLLPAGALVEVSRRRKKERKEKKQRARKSRRGRKFRRC